QPDGQWEVSAPPESKNRSVLVVDKNETSQYILRRYLEAGGVKVETVSTIGAAARLLDTSSAHRFDLAFLDSRMSNEDSFAFVESQVRERPEMAARFVLMTRRTSDLEKRRGQELRIHSFLVKPIKRDDVWQLLRDSSVDPDGQPGHAIVFNQKKKTEPRPLHILLVEDNEDNRTLFQAFVRSANNAMAETNPRYVETDLYRVDEATNGEQAVELSARTNYDVIFMDIQLPVMDGLTATRQIRRRELDEIRKGGRRSHTPIFALTAYALKEEMEKSMAAGCTGHINKPLKKKALLELLESFTES
ncbi:MAG: response regulator, partial [Leptospiraceae bacterium]|nr:response regulator [Leptospiraceae bacterium]